MTTFRGFEACACLAAWLPVYEAELQRRGTLVGPLKIYQLIGGAAASGGTHATGGAFDISDLGGDVDLEVARQMGADATWSRTPAQGFMQHIHGVLRGCPHNSPARYQIDAVDDGYNGLGRKGQGGPDDGPRPLSGRTWTEGIAWAEEQNMTLLEELTKVCARRGVTRVWGARVLLGAAFRAAKPGPRKAKIGAARSALVGVDSPKR